MNYRRKWGTSVWHSSPECPHWPQSELEAEERDERPGHGDFCPDCPAKEAAKEAETPTKS